MSCGCSLCIECGRLVGVSWGDTNCRCHCGGDLVFGSNREECEKKMTNSKSIKEEAGLVFHKGKYISKDDPDAQLYLAIEEIGV